MKYEKDVYKTANEMVKMAVEPAQKGKKEQAINGFQSAINYLNHFGDGVLIDWGLSDFEARQTIYSYKARIQKRIDNFELYFGKPKD